MAEGFANYPDVEAAPRDRLLSILWDDLKPFPGRGRRTLRLAIACTAVVLVSNTFRLPLQDVLPFLVLFASKEEKVTTAITVFLALIAITVAVGAAILIFKCTGNRPEFRIPAMAAEIFVGMYLFRILSIGPVGFILAFIVSVCQSLVDLFPTPEEAVHRFLWVWVAVASAVSVAWVVNVWLFPDSAKRLLQQHFVDGWGVVGAAARGLATGSPSAVINLIPPLVKRSPIRLLKLLKLSLLETPGLRQKQRQLTRLILGLDKTARLTLSYAGGLIESRDRVPSSAIDKEILGKVITNAEHLKQEFSNGFVPSGITAISPQPASEDVSSLNLVEAQNTLEDLSATEKGNETYDKPAHQKKSLFVADAFTNPRHVQFALKVTLAGMLGYFFYSASDYFGIHTVFYTPLIIALASTGATMHKGLLRIAGCIIGVALGLVSSIWLIPRFETLGIYLLIVFCVHGLAAWIVSGSERISYIGLQIALTFDLGVLQGYGPSTEIDPLRDRFIGIILGLCIVSAVFSLVWPESAESIAREKLAACLRAIASLLRINAEKDSNARRAKIELEIGTRLSEADLYEEQAAFESLIYERKFADRPGLEEVSMGVEEIYVACLPWLRVQTKLTERTQAGQYRRAYREVCGWLARRMEKLAFLLESGGFQETGSPESFEGTGAANSQSIDSRSLETLERSVGRLESLFQTGKQHS